MGQAQRNSELLGSRCSWRVLVNPFLASPVTPRQPVSTPRTSSSTHECGLLSSSFTGVNIHQKPKHHSESLLSSDWDLRRTADTMPPTTTPHIPWPYTLFLLYIEPLAAFLGAIQAAFLPDVYLSFFTADTIPRLTSYATNLSPDLTTFNHILQIPLDQLAACYVLFAWNQAITLRIARHDIRVWKTIVLGIALCDVLHLWGAWRMMGEAFLDMTAWRWQDWVNMAMLWPPLVMRLCFVAGVGLREGQENVKRK